MKKDIKDYLPFYIGQEAIADGNRFKIIGVLKTENGTLAYNGNSQHDIPEGWWIENCDFKLTLRPLSDMTDRERTEYGLLFIHRPDFGISSSWAEREEWDLNESAKTTNWCRKNGFDVDGLIKCGLAIDKNTLK